MTDNKLKPVYIVSQETGKREW